MRSLLCVQTAARIFGRIKNTVPTAVLFVRRYGMTNFEKIKSMSEEEFLRCIMVCPNEFNYIGSEAWCKKKVQP